MGCFILCVVDLYFSFLIALLLLLLTQVSPGCTVGRHASFNPWGVTRCKLLVSIRNRKARLPSAKHIHKQQAKLLGKVLWTGQSTFIKIMERGEKREQLVTPQPPSHLSSMVVALLELPMELRHWHLLMISQPREPKGADREAKEPRASSDSAECITNSPDDVSSFGRTAVQKPSSQRALTGEEARSDTWSQPDSTAFHSLKTGLEAQQSEWKKCPLMSPVTVWAPIQILDKIKQKLNTVSFHQRYGY